LNLLDTFPDCVLRSIKALLELDARGPLALHGIGGHARQLLESAPMRREEIEVAA